MILKDFIMVNEIELKLAVGDIHEEQLNTLLHHFHVIEQQEAFLTNTYYDTADNYFTQQCVSKMTITP